MNDRHAARLAIPLWISCIAFAGASIALQLRYSPDDIGGAVFVAYVFYVALLATFSTVGTFIVVRQPRNVIGWILCAIGFISIGLEVFPDRYALSSIDGGRSLPADEWAAWVATWSESLGIGLLLTFMLLLFPTGRLPSPRWRMVAWLAAAWIGLLCITRAFSPGELYIYEPLQNPVGLDPLQEMLAAVQATAEFGYLIVPLLSMASVFVRFRRARGRERQQLKWFAYNAMLIVLGLLIAVLGELRLGGVESELHWVPLTLALASMPVIIAIAILRHRLYDIDRIINRTLVYGALTASLFATYLLLILGLGAVGREVAGYDSTVGVAASTLAVAALVRPLRSRIQSAVDRRFYRRKYDAARIVETFSARLRDEIDLPALSRELQSVVVETMQPAHMSLWLRPPERIQ